MFLTHTTIRAHAIIVITTISVNATAPDAMMTTLAAA